MATRSEETRQRDISLMTYIDGLARNQMNTILCKFTLHFPDLVGTRPQLSDEQAGTIFVGPE